MLRLAWVTRAVAIALPLALVGCKGSSPTVRADASLHDAGPYDARLAPPDRDAPSAPDAADLPDVNRGEAPPPMTNFCDLPGSIVWSGGAMTVVPGGPSKTPDLSWMKLPDGFCSHYFATVPETRQLRFSPSGDLFVASPSQASAGGAVGGIGAIVVLPDDNHDGFAEAPVVYLGGGDASPASGSLAITQGMLFYDGSFYYQNGTAILKTPYTSGQRTATGPGQQVVDITIYESGDHWPKVLDVDDHGNIYVTNGGDEGESCDASVPQPDRPFHGGVIRIDGTPNGSLVARGLRNVYALRCAKGTGMCFGLELARDFAADLGSREKLIPIRQGDDWGFPCCATANLAYAMQDPIPDCTGVAAEEDSFVIDHTPFGLDFEEGSWSGTWKYRAFIGMHGYFGSWIGARVVAIATDTRTGWPVNAAEADGGTAMVDFATGWDDNMQDHGRPAAVAFAPDGRLFIGNDWNGQIVWVAPVTH